MPSATGGLRYDDTLLAARHFQTPRTAGNVHHVESAPRTRCSKDIDILTVPAQEHFPRQARHPPRSAMKRQG
jgi:hypothetical protein